MAFVLEKISEEDNKKHGFGIYHKSWSIDRERDMFLIHVGGMGRSPVSNYELHCGEEIVKVSTECTFTKSSLERDTTFVIRIIEVPVFLKPKIEEIKSAISEALASFGYFGNPEKLGVVTIKSLDDSKIHFIPSSN